MKVYSQCFLIVALAALAASVAAGEVVAFTNGDSLSGSWVTVEGRELVFNSDAAGSVTLPWRKRNAINRPGYALHAARRASDGRLSRCYAALNRNDAVINWVVSN